MTKFLELTVEGVESNAEVVSFRGRERLSELYRFDLQLRTESPISIANWRGRRAHFAFRGELGARSVQGILTRVSDAPPDARNGFMHTLRLVPELWLAKKRVRSRIFQDLSVHQIVSDVAREWQQFVLVGGRADLPLRGYCVQYRESDYAFLRRLLAEYGLSFRFASGDEMDELEIGDDSSFLAALSYPLVYRRRGAGIASEDSITDFRLQTSVESGDFTLTEFDWRRPERGENAVATADPETGGYDETRLRIDDHHQEYERWSSVDMARARARLESVRSNVVLASGSSFARGLAPGVRFHLSDHAEHDGLWLAVEVLHEGNIEGLAESRDLYRNEFRAVPAATRFRPKRPRRVLDQVVESAIVTGPQAEAVYVDEWGRIKVKFLWDTHGEQHEHSSCWIRVLQPWAGPNWGHQFLPRVGMEVLVTFVGGDTDQPVVLGSLYNETRPEPYPLPENRTKSGIRTQSIGNAAGYNELSFEDAAGREEIGLRAERNLRVRVNAEHVVDVGGAEDHRVGGDSSHTVGGHDVRVIGASANLVVGGGVSEAIGGPHNRIVGGSVNLDAASLTATLRGDAGASVDGPLTLATAAITARADGGLTLTAGRAVSLEGNTLTLRGATSGELHAAELFLSAERLTLTADRLAIRCGPSLLEMDDKGIRISGPAVEIDGHDKLELLGDQSRVLISEHIEATASTVVLSGSGADLTLDGNATLRGRAIALKRNGGASTSISRETTDPTPPAKLLFSFYVGERSGAGERTALFVETPQGERLTRKTAAEAVERVAGHVTWALDPDDYDKPVFVFVEDDHGERHHIAGPADPRHLRDVMAAGDVAAEERLRGAQRERPRRASSRGGGVVIEELSVIVDDDPSPTAPEGTASVTTTRIPLR